MADTKRRRGDCRDAVLVRDMDSMHVVMPHLMPNRADNEAFLKIKVDMTAMNAYLEEKNRGLSHEDRYTPFHMIVSALVKTVALRPKLNRFIRGRRYYERRDISVTFVVKKQFTDEAHESVAFLHFGPDDTADTIHARIMDEIHSCRKGDGAKDSTEDTMAVMKKMPRWMLRFVFWILRRLDFYGRVPGWVVASDPNYAGIFLTNLGSIGLDAAYHHLNNWGTNSLFVTVGHIHEETTLQRDGTPVTKSVLEIGVTLDERIADGYYYAGSMKILKKLLEEPALLERPAKEEIAL